MLEIVLISLLILFGLGIIGVIKKGFNQVIEGLQSLDERLKSIEEKLGDSGNA